MKMLSYVSLILLLAVSTVAAGQAASQNAPAVAANDDSYVIGAEDVVAVSVWKEPDFSATLPVRPDGKISLPLLGDLPAAGKTPAKLAEDVTALLKKYVEAPRVTVTVTAVNSRNYFVYGEVMRPGKYSLSGGMNVLQAISTAGGLTLYANSKKIYVLRTENGRQSRLPFNYREALNGGSSIPSFELKTGDTVVVP